MSEQLTDSPGETGVAGPRTRRTASSPQKKASKDRSKKDDDGGQGLKPMSKADAMKLLTTELTINPEQAGLILGLGRSSSYRAVRSGQLPSIQIGGLYLVSTAVLRRILETGQLTSPSPQAVPPPQPSPPTTPKRANPPRRRRRRR